MPTGISVQQDLRLTLPDGVGLSADVYTPDVPGRYPTLLMRLPYGSAVASSPVYCHPAWYAAQGFCVVVQDVRGSWRSEGSFYPRRDETADTLATIEWASQLPRSNGNVGMYGFSYQGVVQLQAAAGPAGALKAIAPAQTAADFYSGWHYEGGVPLYQGAIGWGLQLAWIAAIHDQRDADAARYRRMQTELGSMLTMPPALPPALADVPWIHDWICHETFDAYWQEQVIPPAPEIPALWIAGWYDTFLNGTIQGRAAAATPGAAEQSMIAGAWQHQPWSRSVGVRDFGPDAVSPVDNEQVAFFKHYLAGEGEAREASCRIFVTGLDEWRTTPAWPPATETLRLFLDSDGDANAERGSGTLSPSAPSRATFDVFTSEPLVPVPTTGGRGVGPADQRPIERLRALLTFTSEPLEHDLWVTGFDAHLTVAASGTDCDWVARLCEVEPGGRSLDVTQGALRSRYRSGLDHCEALTPFKDETLVFPSWDCCHLFKAGNRLRLHIAGSSFPYYGRNPGSCVPVAELPANEYVAVSQFLLHGPGQESWLALRVADLREATPFVA
jgi:putative CocE/NonD family hydrolase